MVFNPTAAFLGEESVAVSGFFSMDRTRQAPQGLAGHHYWGLAGGFGVRPGLNLWVYHNRVLGRYEEEHIQSTGFLLKQKVGNRNAFGVSFQLGGERGYSVFFARQIPLMREKGEGGSPILQLHTGLMWAHWRGEWNGDEWIPYLGLNYRANERLSLTAEIRERQEDFLKPNWLVAAHYQLGPQWILVAGLHQSGLSDRPYPFIALGTGIILR